jgi:hypothetical protein
MLARTSGVASSWGRATPADDVHRMEPGELMEERAMTTLLVGALTGHYELSEEDRQAVGEWMVDHADEAEVRELLTKIVRTQISDTSEFRVKVAEAIREKFKSDAAIAPVGES